MLYDFLFTKLESFKKHKQIFLVFFVLLTTASLAFYVGYLYLFKPKAQDEGQEKVYLAINTTPLLNNSYLKFLDSGEDHPLEYQVFQDLGHLPAGRYTFRARAWVKDLTPGASLKVILNVSTLTQQPEESFDAAKDTDSRVLGEIADGISPPPGSSNPPTIGSPVAYEIDFFQPTDGFKINAPNDAFSIPENAFASVKIVAERGVIAYLDFVSLKKESEGEDNTQTEELIKNWNFSQYNEKSFNRYVFKGWGAGTPGSAGVPEGWGVYYAWPVKIYAKENDADSSESTSGLFMNSIYTPDMRNKEVVTRYERGFDTDADKIKVSVKAFAPVVRDRGAAIWIQCIGRPPLTESESESNASGLIQSVSAQEANPTPNYANYKCLPKDNSLDPVGINHVLGYLYFEESNLLKNYEFEVPLKYFGPYAVRIVAMDGSELFVSDLKITNGDNGEEIFAADFSLSPDNLIQRTLKRRFPEFWQFGTDPVDITTPEEAQGVGFELENFAFVVSNTQLGIQDNNHVESGATNTPIPSPTQEPIEVEITNLPTPVEETYCLGNQVFQDLNKDSIYDSTVDRPFEGIRLTLFEYVDNIPVEKASTVSNKEGIYSFCGLTRGRYEVRILLEDQPEGWQPAYIPEGFSINGHLGDEEYDNHSVLVKALCADYCGEIVDLTQSTNNYDIGLQPVSIDITSTPTPPVEEETPTNTPTPVEEIEISPTQSVGGQGPTNTPTLTPSPTPVSVSTSTPTPTRTPTPTKTPTPTPTSEPQQAEGDLKLNLALRFQGINSKPRSGIEKIKVLVSLREFGSEEFIHKVTEVTVDNAGIWRGSVIFTPDDGFSSGNYLVYIKGPRHLQKKICDLNPIEDYPAAYKCAEGKSLELSAGDEIDLNLTRIILLAGDLPEQDGLINAYDIGLVYLYLGRTDEEAVSQADINFDGVVNITDFILLQAALSVRYDEGSIPLGLQL